MKIAPNAQNALHRLIQNNGTPEAAWQAWDGLARMPVVPIDALVPFSARLVVVAPHPDDEILSGGGLLAQHTQRGGTALVVAVTDGEASHGRTSAAASNTLAETRCAERSAGLQQLGCGTTGVRRLAMADGTLANYIPALKVALAACLQPGDVVLTTWRLDGHPDHEACGAAAALACAELPCRLLEAPVWMWHWAAPHDRQVPWRRLARLPLATEQVHQKQRALAAHSSQLVARGNGQGPVLGHALLERLARKYEYFFI